MNSTSSEDINAARANTLATMGDTMGRKDTDVIKAIIDQHISAEDLSTEDQWSMNVLKSMRVNIAIIGVSGAGKSSFVNALRGLDDDEEHSAKTEVPTIEPTPYPYPPIPNFILWDLPGMGTSEFEAEKYLKQVNFDKYDLFILVGQEPLTRNDIHLVHEIKKMKKKFYYVRTKVDISIDVEQQKMTKNLKEKETLYKIRKACEEDLRAREPSPRVFLISRWELDKYDFPCLLKQMERDQDVIKKDALCLKPKKVVMEDYIWQESLASCASEPTPIPKLSFLCDLHILVAAMNHIRKFFGLNGESLNIMANRFGKSVDELKSQIQNCSIVGEISEQMAINYLKKSEFWGRQTMVELARDSKTKGKPLVAVASSLACTHFMLTNFLDEVMGDAKNVIQKAAEEKVLRSPDLAQTMISTNSEDIDAAITEAMARQDAGAIKATVARKYLQRDLTEDQLKMGLLRNVIVDIGVTGTSCAGKLSLINTLLNVDDDDEHAATAMIKEGTTVPIPYFNPLFPNLIMWDLPGIGTPDFKPDTYPAQADFDRYDIFIIVVSEGFTENDEKVAREIKKTKKKVYSVITKGDIYKDYKQEKKNFQNDRKTKKTSSGVSQTCTWIFFHYAFPSLIEEMKQDVLEMFLPGLTNGGLRQKKEAMENYIWKQSLASCAAGKTTVRCSDDVFLTCDISRLVAAMNHICKVFGLDEESLSIVAERFGKSDGELKSAIQSYPIAGEVNTQMVTELLKWSEIWRKRMVMKLAKDYRRKISNVFIQSLSFVSTFYMLKNFLKVVVRGAEIVLAKAAE